MTGKEDSQKLISTAGLLLMDAMILQEIVAQSSTKVSTLSSIGTSSNVKRELESSWQYIVDNINYEPVLEIALRILRNMPGSATFNSQLKLLMEVAYDIASSKVLLRHDLFGRIYHTLLLGNLVKYHATFYTSIPAARLLARMLVNLPSKSDMKNVPPKYSKKPLRVADFACGSGTLLSAVYKEIDARYRIESRKSVDINKLHEYLIEEGIWGFDVLHHAIHLASTVLSLHNPIPVHGSRLYALRLGDGKFLGSLNFLKSSLLAPEMVLTGENAKGPENISVAEKKVEPIDLPKFQLCIMNPPFTRSVGGNLLFGSLPAGERSQLQKVFSDLLKERGLSGIGQAGLAAAFFFLGDKYLDAEGRAGFVLPRSVLTGVSWQKVREILLESYHVEYIITSYQSPKNWNFSENTSLSEVMLVVRKTKEKDKYTTFVNLTRKPSNEIESIYIGTLLSELYRNGKLYDIENSNASPYSLKLQGKKIGEVYTAKLQETNFGFFNFFSQMELNRILTLLRRGIIYLPDKGIAEKTIPMTSLSKLGVEIGPDRSQVHSVFEIGELDEGSIYKAFWGYDSSAITSISQRPNMSLTAKNGMQQARNLWTKAGQLLLVERCRLNTFAIPAMFLDEPALSNVLWPIKADQELGKILAVWLNSTFGLFNLLSTAEVTEGPWIDFKKENLSDMPIINVRKLTSKQKKAFLDLYDEISNLPLKAIPEEYQSPSTKKTIDDGISKILGLDMPLDTVYRLLANDSMIKAA